MPYVPFNEHFPDIAENETRTITVLEQSDLSLPPGDYTLIEMYCNERKCDCRRVFFYMVSLPKNDVQAVIAYGWESREFYAKWMRSDDPKMIKDLRSPMLNQGSPQSSLAPAILNVVKDIILKDKAYMERIKSHYRMFRDKIDRKLPLKRKRKRGRIKLKSRLKR